MEESQKNLSASKQDNKASSSSSIPKQSKNNAKDRGFNNSSGDNREVLIKAGPLEYKLPGKRQRIILGSVVVGLNLLLVIAVILYYYVPSFQDFVYNFGRS